MENIEISAENEYVNGSYIHATAVNPDKKDFLKILKKGKFTILDIGCGKEPRLSWTLEKDDMWVGCDPAIKLPGENNNVSIQLPDNPINRESSLVVFTESVRDIPSFKPDYISIIAPNPKDIVDDKIFNEHLEKFLSDEKEQHIIIALDNRTYESAGYREEAIETIRKWMKDKNFENLGEGDDYEDLEINSRFQPNSADLGELDNLYMLFYHK